MKFNFLQLFHLHHKKKLTKRQISNSEDPAAVDENLEKGSTDLLPHVPFRVLEPRVKHPVKNQAGQNTAIIRKSKSFSDLGQNVVTSIKRSSSYQRLSKNLNKSHGNVRLPLATLEEHRLDAKSICSDGGGNHKTHITNLREPSIIDFIGEDFGHDCLTEGNTTNETYTSLFNSIYADYYHDHDSDSVQSSAISEKQIVPRSDYLLSSSGTPNYAIAPQLLPPFPSFATANPFADFDDFNQLPHEKLLLRASQIHGLSPTDSLSSAIKSYRKSLYCESDQLDSPRNDDELIFCNERGSILPLPKIGFPHSPLPPLPNSSPTFSSPYKYSMMRRNITMEETTDLDEKSLFDALSKAECWDCSKITLVTYND